MRLAREFWGKHFLIGIIGKGKAPSTRFLEARQLFYHHEEARLSREKKRGGTKVLTEALESEQSSLHTFCSPCLPDELIFLAAHSWRQPISDTP